MTGAGRGIGEGIARVLAAAGASVVVAARRTEEIERVAEAIEAQGGRALAVTTDVTDDSAVEALARAARDEFGRLDVWVNNAVARPSRRPSPQLPREEWDANDPAHLTAIWVCTNIAASHMEDGGRILKHLLEGGG